MEIQWYKKFWFELTKDEVYNLLELRIEVFVMEQNCPYQEADGKDKESVHFFAMDTKNSPIAYLRVIPPGISYPEWSIGRVATRSIHRNQGLGKSLMRQALEWVDKNHTNQDIRISAQTYLQQFYESFGFENTGKAYLEDGIPHIEMLRISQL